MKQFNEDGIVLGTGGGDGRNNHGIIDIATKGIHDSGIDDYRVGVINETLHDDNIDANKLQTLQESAINIIGPKHDNDDDNSSSGSNIEEMYINQDDDNNQSIKTPTNASNFDSPMSKVATTNAINIEANDGKSTKSMTRTTNEHHNDQIRYLDYSQTLKANSKTTKKDFNDPHVKQTLQ